LYQEGERPMLDTLKTTVTELYTDAEARPQRVADLLASAGANKLLSRVVDEAKAEKVVQYVAEATTYRGLSEKASVVREMAAPYIEKAGNADGRKQLLEETKELAAPYLAPYISSVKETTAPYMAKFEELRRSEKIEKMVEAFNDAREHPAEKVEALKAKAVDLIKYENVRAYREQWNVMSAEFHADTARLIKELPVVASAAAQRGADKVKTTAIALAEELETHTVHAKTLLAQGYEVASQVELEAIKQKVATTSSSLLKQMEQEVASGVELYKVEGFSLQDFLERLKRVGSAIVVEGKALLASKEEEPQEGEEEEKPMEDTQGAFASDSAPSEKDVYEDAAEDAPDTPTPPVPIA